MKRIADIVFANLLEERVVAVEFRVRKYILRLRLVGRHPDEDLKPLAEQVDVYVEHDWSGLQLQYLSDEQILADVLEAQALLGRRLDNPEKHF